ncbi:signal peptidase I [Alkalihalobacillus alcalophilus ATCC 27647 = CGMCC 1.3604]|uniref:Signal peptidase I n=1 Tax=Alkalihalobacillus alcalophilus ATCC 27647 = CGMCC 1.3604 TaxID=1218173 RepID=A0A094WJF0_ALKAL|nr:signal peptidase I [Alkalihalobacillus alcalophilus]KGA96083.1 signal peptidase [Alkalihalobacillus alcalophilus ATCC 27647 = CGMCC 1.3604]MED1561086.1 signal peptidase I [Alkalihalobacillus alcalophilus]THG88786.1 signal peptidase I [Alkalihalobacillus alcalophilus ATCC 27647 = CGMCC 1.3604]
MYSEQDHWIEGLKAILLALLLAIIIRTFLFASYEVSGESMMPTAYDGERFIVNKVGYEFLKPKRFDMIVFHANEEDDYIKRVIGLPGETIMYLDDVLYIDGLPVEEPFLEDRKKEYGPYYTQDFYYYGVIPDNHVFVLGDNRPNSTDSRRLGPINQDEIVGKVDLRFWPITEVGIMK